MKPRLDEAQAGNRHVFFVDASHFVLGMYSGCLWTIGRKWIPASTGRQRFNVLGAYDAVTRQLVTITNTTVVNTETMCELLEKMSKLGLKKPVTIVLDNARYQRNAFVMELAEELGIELLFLPSYSPNLNLIERLWRLIKRTALYGRYYANFKLFKAAIEKTIDELHTVHREKLESMMTLKFQTFKEVLLVTA